MSAQQLLARIPATFWRFGLIGVGGLFVDMAVLYAAMWGLGCSAISAKVLSFLAAATFTWWMNRRYTFGASGKALLHEWASFLSTNAFGGAVNFAVYTAIVTQTPAYFWIPALATAMGSVSGLLFNYLSAHHIVFKTTEPRQHQQDFAIQAALPGRVYPLTLLVSLLFGGLSLYFGMDANWDLLNYHWYNGWLYTNDLTARDLLVSQIPSFYNPILDIPYAYAAEHTSAKTVGFALGMLHGLNFLPLFAISWRLFTIANRKQHFLVAAAVALAGLTGAGALTEVGRVFYDNLLSLCVSVSVCIVVWQWPKLVNGSGLNAMVWAMLAGVPVGLAFGVKQPMVIYCLGLCAAFLFADSHWLYRIRAGFCFGIGVLLGFAVGGGYWAWHLWQSYGNPLFPYFNQVFQSPWGLPIPYRDVNFVPNTLAEKLLFIFRFSFKPFLVSEHAFRDFRLLALICLIPLTTLVRLWRKPAQSFAQSGPALWLLAAGFLTYAIWVSMFSIYRYMIALEMLTPMLLVAAIGLLPITEKLRTYSSVALLTLLAALTVPADWPRKPWTEKVAEVNGIADLVIPNDTLVLMAGHEPMSYLVPAFPKQLRFYRIDSNFRLPDDFGNGFRKLFQTAIKTNPGPIAVLYFVANEINVTPKLAEYSLDLDKATCRPITSPIAVGPYAFCYTRKINSSS